MAISWSIMEEKQGDSAWTQQGMEDSWKGFYGSSYLGKIEPQWMGEWCWQKEEGTIPCCMENCSFYLYVTIKTLELCWKGKEPLILPVTWHHPVSGAEELHSLWSSFKPHTVEFSLFTPPVQCTPPFHLCSLPTLPRVLTYEGRQEWGHTTWNKRCTDTCRQGYRHIFCAGCWMSEPVSEVVWFVINCSSGRGYVSVYLWLFKCILSVPWKRGKQKLIA